MKVVLSDESVSVFFQGELVVVKAQSHPFYEKIRKAVENGEPFEHFLDVRGQDKTSDALRKFLDAK